MGVPSEWSDLRRSQMQAIREASTRPLPPMAATASRSISEYIEAIAVAVAHLPDVPVTVTQRSDLRTIARELWRRSQS